jgi:hypothetical protein
VASNAIETGTCHRRRTQQFEAETVVGFHAAGTLPLVNAVGKAGEEMRKVKLKWIAILGVFVLGATITVPVTQANPPFPSATYTGTTSQGGSIVLVVNSAGNALAAGSYIDFQCGANPLTRHYLDGALLNIPAGVTNTLGTGVRNSDGSTTPGFEGGTLSWRFFGRFFAQAGAPPAGGGGQTQPPGNLGTGDFSGRNVTGIPGGVGFCSFRATWNVAMTASTPMG